MSTLYPLGSKMKSLMAQTSSTTFFTPSTPTRISFSPYSEELSLIRWELSEYRSLTLQIQYIGIRIHPSCRNSYHLTWRISWRLLHLFVGEDDLRCGRRINGSCLGCSNSKMVQRRGALICYGVVYVNFKIWRCAQQYLRAYDCRIHITRLCLTCRIYQLLLLLPLWSSHLFYRIKGEPSDEIGERSLRSRKGGMRRR